MPAWPALVKAELAAEKAARTGRDADVVTRYLCLVEHPFTPLYEVENYTTSAVAYVTYSTFDFYRPLQWAAGTLKLWLRSYVTGGTGVFRVSVSGGNTGADVSVTNLAYAVNGPASVVLPASVGLTAISIEYKAQTSFRIYAQATYDSFCVVER